MDREKAKYAQSALQDALNKLNSYFSDEYKGSEPMFFETGNIKYNSNNAVIQVKVADVGDDGQRQTPEVVDFLSHAEMFGFKKEDLGASFESRGKKFKISGFLPKSYRFPVLATRTDGKEFKFPIDTVLMKLGRPARNI